MLYWAFGASDWVAGLDVVIDRSADATAPTMIVVSFSSSEVSYSLPVLDADAWLSFEPDVPATATLMYTSASAFAASDDFEHVTTPADCRHVTPALAV